MGLGDLFSKEGRAKRSLEKNISRAVNKHAQSPDRWKALEGLRDDGSHDALVGMLHRFDFTYDKGIEDEQEKNWVYEALIGTGQKATVVEAVRSYLKTAQTYSWPLRILETVATEEQLLTIVDDLLAKHPPGYERDPSRKEQVIQWMSELRSISHEQGSKRLVPYLDDVDEGVRFQAVNALRRFKDEASAREPLLTRFVDPAEESHRLRLRILEIFAEAGWAVTGFRPKVEERLPEQFMLDAKGVVKKK